MVGKHRGHRLQSWVCNSLTHDVRKHHKLSAEYQLNPL